MQTMVITPQALWKDFDRKLMPLGETEISRCERDGALEQLLYFNGEPAAPGCTRVFARLVSPVVDGAVADGGRVVLLMLEPQTDILTADVQSVLESGYSALLIDYAGDYGGRTRFTLYPRALSFANYPDNAQDLFTADTPTKSCWYVWAVSMLRAVTLLENRGYSKIALLGIGAGGAQVWKTLAYDTVPVCGITLFSSLNAMPESVLSDTADARYLMFKASLDTPCYAPLLRGPLLEIITTNDRSGTFDRMNEIYSSITRDDCRFCIEPRADRTLSSAQYQNMRSWLAHWLCGTGAIPPKPVLSASASDKQLYYELHAAGKPHSVSLYTAQPAIACAFRNWRKSVPEKIGEDAWLQKIAVYQSDKPFFAFATAEYDGFTVCSSLVTRVPAALGVGAAPYTRKRLIYDADMGVDDWLTLSSSHFSKPIRIRESLYGINGVLLEQGNLSTFKLGEAMYRGDRDYVLQLMLYSSVEQDVTFVVTDGTDNKQYKCVRSISPKDDWAKLTLAASDFKAADGVLDGWDSVALFEIHANHNLFINCLLWV